MEKTIVKTYRKDCFLGYDPLRLMNEVEVAVIIEYHKYRNVANLLQDNEVKSPYMVKHEVKHLPQNNKIQIITEMGVFENEGRN